jgi:hypothetical protein
MPKNTLTVRDVRTSASKMHKAVGARATKAVPDRPQLPAGWLTSDDDEIRLRRWRGQTEIRSVSTLETNQSYF